MRGTEPSTSPAATRARVGLLLVALVLVSAACTCVIKAKTNAGITRSGWVEVFFAP